MDSSLWKRLREIYERAVELAGDEREQYLTEACADDQELRAEVAGMLASAAADSLFLAPPTGSRPDGKPPAGAPAVPTEPLGGLIGKHIGSFEIARAIASGGMGTVYEAWQAEPRRKVALKLMRAGFGGDAALRRFRFEAEVLGRLRHPGIAQIYEAGVVELEEGGETPYFAMEFVEGGRDLLESAADLDLRPRVALFVEVCDAIQHGHQQGVIHRDLKPQNILVDGEGRPMVIDFGIARATGENPADADSTQLTQAGELLGTLRYMSPEQLGGDPAAIDTRSDVYALGTVLYELTCGRPPFEFGGRSLLEISRAVIEEPPIAPRTTDPTIPEDLACILLKALEKEPGERYASASELAADLRRFLNDEPVVAVPHTGTYRLRKFVRRHKAVVALASIAVLALILGAAGAGIGLLRAQHERDVARAENSKFRGINRVLEGMFTSVDPDQDGREVLVADLLDRSAAEMGEELAGEPTVEAALRAVIGESYFSLGLREEARRELETAIALQPDASGSDRLNAMASLASVLLAGNSLDEADSVASEGLAASSNLRPRDAALTAHFRRARCVVLLRRAEFEGAERALLAALEEARSELPEHHPEVLALRSNLAAAFSGLGRGEESLAECRAVAEAWSQTEGPDSTNTLQARVLLVDRLRNMQLLDEADAELSELLPTLREVYGDEHRRTLAALFSLADLRAKQGRVEESYAILQGILPLSERLHSSSHPLTLSIQNDLASALDRLGEQAAGEMVRRAAFETSLEVFGPNHPSTLENEISLGVLLTKLGRVDEARPHMERVLAVRREKLGDDDPDTLTAFWLVSRVDSLTGNLEAAEAGVRRAFEGRSRTLGPDDPNTLLVQSDLINSLGRLQRFDDALAEMERFLATNRRRLPEEHERWTLFYGNAGNLARDAGKSETAEAYLRLALEHAREHLADDDPNRVFAAADLGELLYRLERYDEAIELFGEGIEAQLERPGSFADQRARCQLGLGMCLRELGLGAEARVEIERAVEIYRDAVGAGDARTLQAQGVLAALPGG